MQSPRSPSISPLRDETEYQIDLEEINKHEDRQKDKKKKKKKTSTPEPARERSPERSPVREKTPDNYFSSDYQQEEEVKDENKIVYRIKELDINTLRPRSIADDGVKYAMIGKPGTGKSSIIKSYMYSKRHIFPVGLFCNGTEDSTQFFSRHVPDLFIHPLSTGLVSQFIRRQKLAKQYLDNPWSLFITDDCMDDPRIFNKPEFKYIFKNGRHLKMSYIMSLQYSIDVKPDIRGCIDGCFILRETNEKFRRNLYENYASVIPTYNEFKTIMDSLTGDYTAIFIDNRSTSNNVEDCVYYYKADLNRIDPNFKFGCKEYHEFSESRYNKNYILPI